MMDAVKGMFGNSRGRFQRDEIHFQQGNMRGTFQRETFEGSYGLPGMGMDYEDQLRMRQMQGLQRPQRQEKLNEESLLNDPKYLEDFLQRDPNFTIGFYNATRKSLLQMYAKNKKTEMIEIVFNRIPSVLSREVDLEQTIRVFKENGYVDFLSERLFSSEFQRSSSQAKRGRSQGRMSGMPYDDIDDDDDYNYGGDSGKTVAEVVCETIPEIAKKIPKDCEVLGLKYNNLFYAALTSNEAVFKALIKSQSSLEKIVDEDGNTILHFIIDNHLDNIFNILKSSVNLDRFATIENKEKLTPFFMTIKSNTEKMGDELKVKAPHENTEGMTALHIAAKYNRDQYVSALSNDEDLKKKDSKNHTPSMIAARYGNYKALILLFEAKEASTLCHYTIKYYKDDENDEKIMQRAKIIDLLFEKLEEEKQKKIKEELKQAKKLYEKVKELRKANK